MSFISFFFIIFLPSITFLIQIPHMLKIALNWWSVGEHRNFVIAVIQGIVKILDLDVLNSTRDKSLGNQMISDL